MSQCNEISARKLFFVLKTLMLGIRKHEAQICDNHWARLIKERRIYKKIHLKVRSNRLWCVM
jgi:hypothetical protein